MKSDTKWFAALLILTWILFVASLTQDEGLQEGTKETQGTKGTKERRAPAAPRSTSLAAQLNEPGGTAQRDVEILHTMVAQFLIAVKEPNRPMLGDNEDFARAFTGGNKAKLVLLPQNHPAVSDGRILDRWGTPYFFHPRAADAIDIRSAGPDRKLFTDDDTFAKTGAFVPSVP